MKKNSILMIAYEILGLIVPLLLTPYLSRKLGASGVGLYSYSYSICLYFVIFIQLGVKLYGKREIAKVNDNQKKFSTTFWEIWLIQLLLFFIVLFSYIVFIVLGVQDEATKKALTIQALELLVGLFDISWFLFGLERFKSVVIRNIIVRLLEIILVFSLIHDYDDAFIYVFIMAISNLIGALSMWLEVKKSTIFVHLEIKNIKKRIFPLLQLFIPVLSTQIFSIVDKTIIGSVLDVKHVGYYENAYKIAKVPVVFVTAIGNVMMPRITKLIADGKKSESQKYMRKSMSVVIMCTSAIAFGLSSVSDVFMPLYLGPGFDESVGLLSILAFMLIFIGWGNVIRTQYMLPSGYDKIYTKSVVFASLINILISLVAVRWFGTFGVAIASLLSEALNCIYSTLKLRKELNVIPFLKDSLIFIVSGVIMYSSVYLLNKIIDLASVYKLIIEMCVGGGIYLAIVSLLGVKFKVINIKSEFKSVFSSIIKRKKAQV